MRNKQILVIEDDEGVRQMLAMALPHYNFAVRVAGSGAEAVALYRLDPQAFAAVLLDVQMEGMDGVQTLAALRQINPDVRCCMMSGHTGQYAPEELVQMGAARVLQKPFSLIELTQILEQITQTAS
jgi:DNA-binding NtrC family response regulator